METDVGIQARDEVIWKDKMVVEVLSGQIVRIYFESVADRRANGLDGVGEKEMSRTTMSLCLRRSLSGLDFGGG